MKWVAEFCHYYQKYIECFVAYQHEWPNNYNWLFEENDALLTHILFVEAQRTGKVLQGEMYQSSINNTTRLIMKNIPVVAMAFDIPGSCVYT